MVIPSDPGVIQPACAGGVRVAFYGRAASPDDAHTAIQNQLRVVAALLPAETSIVGYFADVAAWNGLRGSIHPTRTWSLDGHAVDGGLSDLLRHACRPDRYCDVVACSDPDRLSRRMIDYVRIEDELAVYGVGVVTADKLCAGDWHIGPRRHSYITETCPAGMDCAGGTW